MNPVRGKKWPVLFLMLLLAAAPAAARDVAFVEPGVGGGNATPDEAFKIEPKSEIDIGDSIINIMRRETLFFVNQTSAPIKIEKVALSSDSTVSAQIVNDDCSKESTVPPLSRCAIELSVTPTGPGAWSIELLMTHNGPGRITRAKIDGKTAGSDVSEKKESGLFLSSKDVKPIDFGTVMIGEGKIVRSALMVNDSPSPITLYSIDVIEADKTLQRLDTGCAVDMELKPGESCPVTMVWAPVERGLISTDLIIRHSGQLGFAVIPVRGVAKDATGDDATASNGKGQGDAQHAAHANAVPPPPSPGEVAKEVARAINPPAAGSSLSAATGELHLIGTVGLRAVLLKPDGTTAIVQTGDEVDIGGSSPVKVLGVQSTSATLLVDGKKKDFRLEAVQQLKDRAEASRKTATAANRNGGKSDTISGGLGSSMGGNR
jgi:hypothetical protein